jgi:predicted kinase
MSKLILLCGPPASGKSAVADQCYDTYTYINQDTQGQGHHEIFKQAVLDSKNIVVDRMNFSKAQRSRYIDLAKKHGYRVEISVLHQPYAVCLARCLARKDHPTIKDEQSARSALSTFFGKYERPTPDEADEIQFVYPQEIDDTRKSAICIDLDGTLCNVFHRLHHVRKEGRKDWQSFFKEMVNDTPNQWCIDIIKAMSKDHAIVYCSGRPDSWQKETVEWLNKYGVGVNGFENGGPNYDFHLYMRPRNDSRSDEIIKQIILDFELKTRFHILFTIDDRPRVCRMWRENGLTVLQCNDKEF